MLAAAGRLDRTMGGSLLGVANRGFVFDHTSKDQTRYDSCRRSVYLPVIRNHLSDAMWLFDCTDGAVGAGDRPTSTVASQSLYLLNGDFVIETAAAIAETAVAAAPHVDTFDPKPKLVAEDGKNLPFAKPLVQFAETGKLMASPWRFRPDGQSGIEVSELFPHVARHVDDICFLHSVHGTNAAHGGAVPKLHTGSETFIRPGMGAWITYGIGNENENLPGFITISPTLAHGGVNNWGAGFLPPEYQGVPLGVASRPAEEARVKYIANPRWPAALQRSQIDLIREFSAAEEGGEPLIEARLRSFDLAFRMQAEMPTVQDLSRETGRTLALYGPDDPVTEIFGRRCLMARRFAEGASASFRSPTATRRCNGISMRIS